MFKEIKFSNLWKQVIDPNLFQGEQEAVLVIRSFLGQQVLVISSFLGQQVLPTGCLLWQQVSSCCKPPCSPLAFFSCKQTANIANCLPIWQITRIIATWEGECLHDPSSSLLLVVFNLPRTVPAFSSNFAKCTWDAFTDSDEIWNAKLRRWCSKFQADFGDNCQKHYEVLARF